MFDIVRDSTFGTLLNALSGGRILPFADQRPDYVVPQRYLSPTSSHSGETTRRGSPEPNRREKDRGEIGSIPDDRTQANVAKSDVEKGGDQPEKTPDTDFLVDWDGEDDPDNPKNWSRGKRLFVLFSVCLLTFSVYIGSAIYTASIPGVIKDFKVSNVVATLGLSLYVLAYGIGPLFLSPLQEVPSFGRNPVYIITLALFAILQIPTALSREIGTLLVLRFITGFFASPALATGGASISDIFGPQVVPYAIGGWSMGAVMGPVLGPIVGSFAAQAETWRWPLWELAWLSGFTCVFLFFLLPETLGDTILLRRAQRLRRLTGNPKLRSASEIKQAEMRASEIMKEFLWRPFQLMTEPAVFFINLYLGLAYAIFYLWFEAFPLVFNDIYHMSQSIGSLPFIGIIIGALLSYAVYALYIYYYLNPKWGRQGHLQPEEFLGIAVVAGFSIPISLFTFGWTSRASVHWIAPTIGAGIYMPGIFLIFQASLVYLPLSYQRYAASVLAGNDFFRSTIASAFPLFGRAYFKALGIGGGSSLLAGVALIMIPALYLLMKKGAQLRALSKYATS